MKNRKDIKIFIVSFLFYLSLQPLFGQTVDRLVDRIRLSVPTMPEDVLDRLENTLQPYSDVLSIGLPGLQTDPVFLPYIERYEVLKAQYLGYSQPLPIRNIKIVFTVNPLKTTPHNTTLLRFGFCVLGVGHDNIVVMDRGLWDYYQGNDKLREVIFFHELGHCDLNRSHDYLGIMSPNMIEYLFLGETEALYEAYGDTLPVITKRFREYLETSSVISSTSTQINLEPLYEELFSEQRDRSFITIWSSLWNVHIFSNGNKYRERYGYLSIQKVREHSINDFIDSISSTFLKLACTVFDSHCEEFYEHGA